MDESKEDVIVDNFTMVTDIIEEIEKPQEAEDA